MRGLLTAVGFLTVVPIGARANLQPRELGAAAAWFPVVGVLIGLLLAAVDHIGRLLWDAQVAAALLLAAAVVLTGGLHLDGLMDTADAFFGRGDREHMLAIMRDSRAGALGVAAGVAVLLTKFAAYAHLTDAHHWRVIAAAPMLGRLAMVIGLAFFPSARPSGLGASFAAGTRAWHAAVAAAMTLAITAVLLHWAGLLVAAVVVLFAALAAALASRKLGGLTGDVCGALNEMVEIAVLLLTPLAIAWFGVNYAFLL